MEQRNQVIVEGKSKVKKTFFFNMREITCLNADGNESEKKKLKEKIIEAMFLSRQE